MNSYTKSGTLLILLFVICSSTFAQSILRGKITDQSDNTVLPFVSVILYQYQTNNIIDYTQSGIDGNFRIDIPTKLSVLTLKTSRLGYHPLEQDIVFGSERDTTILLNLQLIPKEEQLQEVVVNGPIIVKEDTIIYDIEHYTEVRDQTLEDVLAKIPGFKIRGDGEIEVNGKAVRKVLIDGEEVSDAGAALLTRSISPENVKSVEVRMDEKDSKLKESLLDATEYVVLDIKLKDELKKSIFGKVRGTVGYQDQIEPGGYLNAFSLKKKAKIHLFAERDRFGEQTISLDQIKNLGSEAFQKLFEIPADFQTLTEREAFEDEIFGFKDFTTAEKDIIGLSTKFTLSPSLDIYLGSYNSYSKDGKGRNYLQEFNTFDFSSRFLETQEITDYSSKNKLDIRFDKNKLKIKMDANAVLFDNAMNTQNSEVIQSLDYRFENKHRSNSFYQNLLAEYKVSDKTGVQLKSSHSVINSDQDKRLTHSDPSYGLTFMDDLGNTIFNFSQPINTDASNLLSQISIYHRSKLGISNFGIYHQIKELTTEKEGFNTENQANNQVSGFSGIESLDIRKWGPYVAHSVELGKFTFDHELRWVFMTYPNQVFEKTSDNFFNLKSNVTYSPPGFDYLLVSFSRRVSQFPLEKLIPGTEITSFQSVVIPRQSALTPRQEMTVELSGAKKIQDINILIDPAVLYGQVFNADKFLFEDSPIVSVAYDQLKAEYLLISAPIIKNFKTIPIDIIIEPEWLINQNQNVDSVGINYNTRTTRSLLGVKLTTQLEDQPFDFFIYPKYSNFLFTNELSESRNVQEMLSLDMTVFLDFFDERFLLTPSLRTVKFLGNVNSDFTNFSLRAEYKVSTMNWFLTIDNLLNDSNFIRQTIYPTYFTSEQNFVFSRFFKIGFEYKFK